mmetsp:Transcript_49893/g.118979  ORF Transcript_49893/g.118979 Transcript_49893/m.118979 type:complete len:705 (-) Transcript_49893:132-2246(-)
MTSSPSVSEPWVEQFTLEGFWPFLLAGGSLLWQTLCLLTGLAVSAALIYVYANDAVPRPFFGLKMPSAPGIQEAHLYWGAFAVAASLTAVMLLSCAVNFSSGFGGSAFSWASAEVMTLSQDIATCVQDVQGVVGAAGTVKKDLDGLFEICPPAIEKMLGSSVSQAKGHIAAAKTEAGLTVKALQDLPGLLQNAAFEISEMSGWLPLLAGLSLIAVLVCGLAVGIYFLASKNATVNNHLMKKLSPRVLTLVLPVCASVAILLLCVAATVELSTAGSIVGFCRAEGGPDQQVLELTAQTAGQTSSSYGFAEYYLTGEVKNPVTQHLQSAQKSVANSLSWLDEYRNALAQTCPKWEAERVYGDLTKLELSLNVSESVLKPSNLYQHYKDAVHVAACSGGSSGLATLATVQMFLGAVCLPFLIVTASWVLDFLSGGGASYQKLGAEDGQSSDDDASARKKDDLNALYYVVYAFSVVIFAVGTWMYLVPQPGVVRPITGTLLFGCGVFLMMNSDLIVTYFLLHEQVEELKKNNEGYQQNLDNEAQQVRDLRRAQKGFDEIDRRFGHDVDRAMKEIKVMQTTARSQVGMTIGKMVKLYLDADGDKRISDAELNEAMETMADIFGAVVKGLRTERLPRMKETIRGHRSFTKDGTIPLDAFSKAFEITLFVPDAKQVGQSVKTVLDDAEIKTAARAAKRVRASPKASPKSSP